VPLSCLELDPPEHTRLRRLVTKAFSAKVVIALEERIRQIVREQLARLRFGDEFELVTELTEPLPMIVIAELLGVEPSRRADFKRWSALMLQTMSQRPFDMAAVFGANIEFIQYFGRALDEARNQAPRADLVSRIAHVEDEGDTLTRADALAFLVLLLIGGNETTTNLVGQAVIALVSNPDQYTKVCREPERIPDVIEETLRWATPAQGSMRLATRNTEVGGVPIPEGAILMALMASAHRDEAVYPDPDRFDIERRARHLAFGSGTHFCIGAMLARSEARIALEELIALGRFELLDPEIRWTPNFMFRGPASLRLALVPDHQASR
jgi:cytochrome P450